MSEEDLPSTGGGIVPRPFGIVPEGVVVILEKVRVVLREVQLDTESSCPK